MLKSACAAALVLAIAASPVLAADGAQSRALGYSADGKYFAFEQYGVQDGSGFPYWDVFVLDLAKDSWAPDTPVRVMVEDETKKLADARKQAMDKASPILTRLSVTSPADLLLANPFTETVPDREKVRFDAYYNSMGGALEPKDRGAYELSVRTLDLPAPPECSDPDFKPMGMKVTIRKIDSDKVTTVTVDSAIPKSRNCPLHYDIEAIYAPTDYDSPAPKVVLIGVYSRGFEGEDRRIIAVPFDLPDVQ